MSPRADGRSPRQGSGDRSARSGGAPGKGGSGASAGRGKGRPGTDKKPTGKKPTGKKPTDKKPTGKTPTGGVRADGSRAGGQRTGSSKSSEGPRAGGRPSTAGTKRAQSATPGSGYPRGGPARMGGPRPTTRPSRVRRPPNEVVEVHDPDGVRLQKVLAQAGMGSRRASEELIAAGRVEVNGQIITDMGVRVDPARAVIHVDGLRLQLDSTMITLALNKPLGVLSAMSDGQGRPHLGDYVADREERLFHVGRLDVDTEGLILLTTDGELANRLAHPRYGVPKVYLAEIDGQAPRDLGRRLLAGLELDDGPAAVDAFAVVDSAPGRSLVELTLHDGRNRIVRRLMEAAGYPVTRLVRTRIGPIRLGDLRTGRTRVIGGAELGSLMVAVDM